MCMGSRLPPSLEQLNFLFVAANFILLTLQKVVKMWNYYNQNSKIQPFGFCTGLPHLQQFDIREFHIGWIENVCVDYQQ